MDFETISENDLSSTEYQVFVQGDSFSGYALDTFDRIVSGIPGWYGYCGLIYHDQAYLYFGSESSVNGSNISFGSDCKEVKLYVDSEGNIQSETLAAPSVSFVLGTSDLAYTNLISGNPTLGDLELSYINVAGLLVFSAALVIIFNRSRR